MAHRIFTMPVAEVYPHYIAKVERKGHAREDVDRVTSWLTGFSPEEIAEHLERGTTFEDFFAAAQLNPNAHLITGVICGVRVEDIEDPLMQKIRWLDKLVDEVARGKKMESILRG